MKASELASAIALLDLGQDYVNFAVPDAIQTLWPHRLSMLTLTAVIIALFLSLHAVTESATTSARL